MNDTPDTPEAFATTAPAPTGADPIAPSGADPVAPSGADPVAPSGADPVAPTGADHVAPSGADVPPDRLAISPTSKHYHPELLSRGIGIRFKGTVRTNVEEYCITEGWVRVQAGKAMDRKGNPLTIKLSGPVEAWFEDLGDNPPVARA